MYSRTPGVWLAISWSRFSSQIIAQSRWFEGYSLDGSGAGASGSSLGVVARFQRGLTGSVPVDTAVVIRAFTVVLDSIAGRWYRTGTSSIRITRV